MHMKNGKRMGLIAVFLLFLIFLPGDRVSAAVKYPKSVRMSKKSATLMVGKTLRLKARLSPSRVKRKRVSWSSDNTAVAVVDGSGRVTVTGCGTARITAVTGNGKRAVCVVKGTSYTVGKSKITVMTQAGKRVYRRYSQTAYRGYYPSYGCVTTAVSIAASAYGKSYTPKEIHKGKASKPYSERYAVRQMGGSTALTDKAAISVRTASQILNNLGIANQAVYTFTPEEAIAQISAHLKSGRPVIAKVNNKKVGGVRLANGHHAIVLVGMEESGRLTFINPVGAKVNYAHGSGNTCRLTLDELVRHHMSPASGNYLGPYVTGLSGAGGYILVG